MTEPLAVKVPEAARRLGIGKTTAYELINAGILPAARVGNVLLVRVADLEATLERGRQALEAERSRRVIPVKRRAA